LNSTKKNDNCGICDGDNSTCEEIRYQMEAPAAYGYNDLIDVPAYSTSIKIERQRSGDDLGCLGILIFNFHSFIHSFIFHETFLSN